MIYLKTPEEIETMRAATRLVSQTLGEVARWIQPGVTTRKLDTVAREFIVDNGGKPACLGYAGFPGTLCIEVNDTVVHGFPSDYVLQEGDIVGIDTVVEKDGFMGDSCYTFAVGEISEAKKSLCRTTRESLYVGIDAAQPGARIGDVANAIQTYCERRNYSIVREMCGHGIGRKMHEDPDVPNYGRRGIGPRIVNGLCFCIEPMVNMGSRNVSFGTDGWTCKTKDHKPSAHYEHTLCCVNDHVEIMTTFDYIHEAITDKFI